ncbi:MAG TPA: hypothetical protein VNI61_02045 [Gemmatimonadales bacterium]|nr:hypothetical protein [Gemmatimonadales bacterium]
MPPVQWARLCVDVQSPLRRGAWYKIVKLGPQDAVVDVKGRAVTVARALLEVVPAPRPRWTVVPSPRNAPRFPPTWGPHYAVCPNCRDRAPLEGRPAGMRCHRCNGFFEVAWNEPYLVA